VKPPHARPIPGPSLRQCGNPGCHICSRNVPGEPPDSGHPAGEESLASLLVGAAFIVMALVFVLFLLPVLAS
jgi:hypothetical protein